MPNRVTAPKPPRRIRRAGWTKPARRRFEKYVSRVQKHLGLSDWTIDVDWRYCPDESCAEIARWDNQRRATLYVGVGFLGLSRADQRNTVVHELVHCLLFDVHHVADLVSDELPGKLTSLSMQMINSEVEQVVDRLAGLLERGLPYPEVPRPPKKRRKSK